MDDQDRVTGVNSANANGTPPADQGPEGEGVPIPARIRKAVEDVRQRAKEEAKHGRDVVREYEERYGSRSGGRSRLEAPPEDHAALPAKVRPPYKSKRRISPADVDANERKWAALAHASTLLTALVALFSAGTGVLITIFIPLFIYFAFRNRSEFVAFHALQAFTIQLVGTVGWLALFLVGTVVWVALLILSALLILVLVGLILLPLVVLMYPLFVLASLALPVGMVIYSVIATVETRTGRDYRYPYIARWVESQMYGGMLSIF
jgi:uncharacterized Tic20 family protein